MTSVCFLSNASPSPLDFPPLPHSEKSHYSLKRSLFYSLLALCPSEKKSRALNLSLHALAPPMHFTRLLETFSVYLAGGKWERRQKRKELGFMFHDDSCWVPAARLVVGGRGGGTFRHCRCHLWKRKSYRDSKARFSDGRTPAFKLQSSTSLQKKLFLCFDEKKGWRKKTSLRNNQWEKRSDRTWEVQPVLSASFSFFLVPREFQHPQSQFEIMRSWRRLQRH